MATNDFSKYRWPAVLGGIFLFLVAVTSYAAWYVHSAIDSGVVHYKHREIVVATDPIVFWIAVGWPAVIGLICAFLAVRLLVLILNMHRKGELFVADQAPQRRNQAPMVDESKRTNFDS